VSHVNVTDVLEDLRAFDDAIAAPEDNISLRRI
jgi:hypothetical protein